MALMLVLATLTVMTVLLADFQDETAAELGSALSARDSVRAEFAARSGLNLARLLIAAEPTIRKQLAPMMMLMGGGMTPPQIPVWEFADQVLGAFNDAQGTREFAALTSVDMEKGKNLGLTGASFDVDIVDEDSKINLNSASRDALSQTRLSRALLGLTGSMQFDPMFSGKDGDGQYSDRQTVCAAMIDWVDPNQNASACDPFATTATSSGAEDSFYQLLDPPYYRKNAPLDSLEELHLVRGISDDYWSTFVDPDPNNPKRRNMTVWGSGKINVNTANAQTFLTLICSDSMSKVCTDPIEQGKFLMLANMLRTAGAGAPIFGSPKAFLATLKQTGPLGFFLKAMGLEPIVLAHEGEVMKTLTAESKAFSIYSRGFVKSGQRSSRTRIHAVVDFKDAPAPLDVQALGAFLLAANKASGEPPPAPAPTAAAPGVPGATPPTSGGLAGFLLPSPAGRVIYYRID